MRKFLCFLMLCFSIQVAYAYEFFELGKNAYENGYYGQAKEYLSIAVKNKPRNVTYKYYYALSLAQLGMIEEAAEQYQAITLSSPNSDEGQKAAYALETMKKYYETNAGSYKLPDGSDENYMTYLILENPKLKRWNKNLLNVYIQQSESSSIAESAFRTWEEKSGQLVRFNFLPSSINADIIVNFTDKLPLIHPEAGYIDGFTTLTYGEDCINNALITIKDRDLKTNEVFSPEIIYLTLLHNIGHAIGLDTHSESDKDIMYWKLTDNNKAISISDLNTLKMLYGISEENLSEMNENPTIHAMKLNKAKNYAEAYPNLPIAWSGLASAYVSLNDYENAVIAIKKAIEIKGADATLYTQLAGYYKKLGQIDLSIENYKIAFDLEPDNKVYLFNWAKACYKNKRAEEARSAVDNYLMGQGFLSNDEISRTLRRMYKQDKEKEKEKIKKNREEKQRRVEEVKEKEQEMFVD